MATPSVGVVAWTAYFIILFAILKFVFKFSAIDTFKRVVAEFSSLAKMRWDKHSINATGAIGSLAFIFLYAFNGTLEKFSNIIFNHTSPSSGPASIIVLLTMVFIYILMCVRICNPNGE